MRTDDGRIDDVRLIRVRVDLAYHGAGFHGFAENEGVDTVAGALASAIETVVHRRPFLVAAGRTDAGVHARRQVVTLDLPDSVDLEALARSLNALCAPRIAVSSVRPAPEGFDARASATWRAYRYVVLNTVAPDPMLVDRAWHVREPLSVALMNLSCDAVMGEQDFAAFCRKPPTVEGGPEPSLKRRVTEAKWTDRGEGILQFDIRANAFCHQMVRSLVGFMVDVGRRRRPPSDMRMALVGRNRNHGSQVAPPHGLTLWEVGYDGARVHP